MEGTSWEEPGHGNVRQGHRTKAKEVGGGGGSHEHGSGFQAHGRPLEAATSFKYMGRLLTASDNNWSSVVKNLRKTRMKWAMFSRILGQEGANVWKSVTVYKAVVNEILLFGSETWMMTPRIRWTLRGFHHRVERCIAGMKPKHDTMGRWYFLPLEAEMTVSGLDDMDTYILCF